jgi:aspartokinase
MGFIWPAKTFSFNLFLCLPYEEVDVMQRLSAAKFGGGLLDRDGKNIPVIMERIKELRDTDGIGPVVVFSAPTGYTDELIRIGESYAQSRPVSANALFGNYENIARRRARPKGYGVSRSHC